VGDKKITKNDLKNSEYYAETKICETICIESKQSLNKQRELDEFFKRKYGNGVNNGSDVRRQMKKDIAETIESNAGPLENQSNAQNKYYMQIYNALKSDINLKFHDTKTDKMREVTTESEVKESLWHLTLVVNQKGYKKQKGLNTIANILGIASFKSPVAGILSLVVANIDAGVVENPNKMLGILAKAVVEKRFDKNLIKKFEEYGKISDLSLKNPKKYHAQKLKIETDILKKINKIQRPFIK